MEGFGRSNSFMDDGDLGLGENFFEENSDLGRVFDDDGGQTDDKSKPQGDGATDDSDSDGNERSKQEDDHSTLNVATDGDNDNESVADLNDNKEQTSAYKKRRRSSAGLYDSDGSDPSPAWHNEVTDRPHREKMTTEIAKLLKARKKSPPSKEWMQQLPHKARVLEDRLYRKASSLEAYLNRSTLKNRLRTLAVTITAHYKNSVKTKRGSKQDLSGISDDSKRHSVAAMMSSLQDSRDSPLMALAGQSSEKDDSLAAPMIVPPISSPSPIGDDGEIIPPEIAMNELARQKQVNEELQKQILENIRQQQQLVHSIRRGSNGSEINPINPENSTKNLLGQELTGNTLGEQINTSMQGSRQRQNMTENDINDIQGSQFVNSVARRSSASSAMVNPSIEAQSSMMRRGSGFNAAQMALMQKQSASMVGPNNMPGINMQHQNMQSEMMMRNSSGGPQTLGSTTSQAQFHAQQDAMMMQTQMQNQAAQVQMQAMMSANPNPFNMAQAAMMAGPNQMNQQAQMALMQQMSANQMNGHSGNAQAEFMRRTSVGNNPNLPLGNPAMMGYPGMMNPAMGGNDPMLNAFANNQQMMQNAAMMQSMNGIGMPQNMTQFGNVQQQNFMAMGNPMMGLGNDGNFPNSMNFQGNKGGGNTGLEPQNSFNW